MPRNALSAALAAPVLLAVLASGCAHKPAAPNPLPPSRANVAFCREGNAKMISDGLTSSPSALAEHLSPLLSDQLTAAQLYFNDHFTNEEAFPELAPGDVRLSLNAGGVLTSCRLILTEAKLPSGS